jgi:hypothetical protein
LGPTDVEGLAVRAGGDDPRQQIAGAHVERVAADGYAVGGFAAWLVVFDDHGHFDHGTRGRPGAVAAQLDQGIGQ